MLLVCHRRVCIICLSCFFNFWHYHHPYTVTVTTLKLYILKLSCIGWYTCRKFSKSCRKSCFHTTPKLKFPCAKINNIGLSFLYNFLGIRTVGSILYTFLDISSNQLHISLNLDFLSVSEAGLLKIIQL